MVSDVTRQEVLPASVLKDEVVGSPAEAPHMPSRTNRKGSSMAHTIAPYGLHHVTAIAEDPQRNVDFYTSVLGLRLVKRTVNFDAPDTYHLYYGDESGKPSTLLTFFPWPGVHTGRQGIGMTTATAFSIPPEALGWWQMRLKTLGVDADEPVVRSDEEVLRLRDPDGLVIELVASDGDSRSGWDGVAAVPYDNAIRGLFSVTMTERSLEPTARCSPACSGWSTATTPPTGPGS
jgi:glyoxalase family protein